MTILGDHVDGGVIYEVFAGRQVLIDREDVPLVGKHRWSVQADGRGGLQVRATSRTFGPNGTIRRTVRMHRLILAAPDGVQVDHINGDTLDNRRRNLRLATPSENQRNRHDVRSKTGYKGVQRARNRWQAGITVDNQARYLGSFPSAEEAALAYDFAALDLHKEFASTNFPRAIVEEIRELRARADRLEQALRYALDCIESPDRGDGEADVYSTLMMSKAAKQARAALASSAPDRTEAE